MGVVNKTTEQINELLDKIDKAGRIRKFITTRNLNIIDFKDLDVIDYGGIVEV